MEEHDLLAFKKEKNESSFNSISRGERCSDINGTKGMVESKQHGDMGFNTTATITRVG